VLWTGFHNLSGSRRSDVEHVLSAYDRALDALSTALARAAWPRICAAGRASRIQEDALTMSASPAFDLTDKVAVVSGALGLLDASTALRWPQLGPRRGHRLSADGLGALAERLVEARAAMPWRCQPHQAAGRRDRLRDAVLGRFGAHRRLGLTTAAIAEQVRTIRRRRVAFRKTTRRDRFRRRARRQVTGVSPVLSAARQYIGSGEAADDHPMWCLLRVVAPNQTFTGVPTARRRLEGRRYPATKVRCFNLRDF